MPELPEVETMVRGVRPHLAGRKLVRLLACPCECRPLTIRPSFTKLAKQVEGQLIQQVRRRAKRIILELESGAALVIEPRMTGLMLVSDPPDPEHLRLEFQTVSVASAQKTSNSPRAKNSKETSSVWFWDRRGLGTVTLHSPTEYQSLLEIGILGPDALEITLDHWHTVLRQTRREIKVALLDQKLVAGIGNLYASEILFRSAIHPQQRASELSATQIERLAIVTRDVLEEAIRYEGSTLSDGTYRNALNQSGGYQNSHRVYDRAGQICTGCGSAVIERIVQAQRSTFFCPVCQSQSTKRPKKRSRTV